MELFLRHFTLWGSTLQHRFLGVEALGTIEPQNLQAILSTNFTHWSMGSREKVMGPLFGRGIFTQSGPSWKHLREASRAQLASRRCNECQIFEAPIERFLDSLSRTKGPIDIHPKILNLTLDITLSMLFEEDTTNDPVPQEFSDAFNDAQFILAKRLRLQEFYWIVNGRNLRRSCKIVREYIDKLVYQRGTKLDCDPILLRDQIINLLVAGRDTTASLITWTLFLLVRHPVELKKLQKELQESFPDDSRINRAKLRSCLYLQDVIKEVLRLYPPVPVNSRTAVRDTILPVGGGPDLSQPIFVSEGTNVAYSIYALHRRPDLYGMDAEIFRPERWAEAPIVSNETGYGEWGYLPFNGGPRKCLGMDLALTEAAYCIVKILRAFPGIKLPVGERVCVVGNEKQSVGLVIFSGDGCRVSLNDEE